MFIHSIAKWSVEVTIALDSQITPLIISRFNDTTHARWTDCMCSLPIKRHHAPFHRPVELTRPFASRHLYSIFRAKYVLAPNTPLCPFHRPNGMTCGAPVCAGRRARHLRWYCDDDELFCVLKHSVWSAFCKTPPNTPPCPTPSPQWMNLL